METKRLFLALYIWNVAILSNCMLWLLWHFVSSNHDLIAALHYSLVGEIRFSLNCHQDQVDLFTYSYWNLLFCFLTRDVITSCTLPLSRIFDILPVRVYRVVIQNNYTQHCFYC